MFFCNVPMRIVAGTPIISSAVMFVGVLVLVVMLVGIPIELLAAVFPRIRVKMTNEQQLKKVFDLIDLVQREDPAKLEKAKALQRPDGKTNLNAKPPEST